MTTYWPYNRIFDTWLTPTVNQTNVMCMFKTVLVSGPVTKAVFFVEIYKKKKIIICQLKY